MSCVICSQVCAIQNDLAIQTIIVAFKKARASPLKVFEY